MQNIDSISLAHVTGGVCSKTQLAAARQFVNKSDGDYDKAKCVGSVVKLHSGEGGDWVPFSSAK